MKKFFDIGKRRYLVKIHQSIYTNRPRSQDVYISRRNDNPAKDGAREEDGQRYNIIAILAYETLEPLRSYEPIPDDVTAWLRSL